MIAPWNRPEVAEPLLLTERQVAKALGLSPRTVWGLADRGELPVVWIGRAKRFDRRDIEAMIDRLKGRNYAQKGSPRGGQHDRGGGIQE